MAKMNDIRPSRTSRPVQSIWAGGSGGARPSGSFSATGLMGVASAHNGGSGAAMRMNPTAARLAGMRLSPKTTMPVSVPLSAPRRPAVTPPSSTFKVSAPAEAKSLVRAAVRETPAPISKKNTLLMQGINLAIYVLILGGIVFGLPKYLTWQFQTSYPMAAITSGSMWPVLKKGDLVVIRGITKDQLAVGDIIVFKNPENHTLTIHRIVKMDTATLTTKGDANFREDQPVPYENVVGKTVLWSKMPVRVPWVGTVTMFVNGFLASTSTTPGTSS